MLKNEAFTESEKVKSEVNEYRKHADSVALFIDESGYEKSIDPERFIALKPLYGYYKEFCSEGGYKPNAGVLNGKEPF